MYEFLLEFCVLIAIHRRARTHTHTHTHTVLSDLPLPSPLPTPIEQCVMGTKELSMEARKLLDNTNPTICSKITEALLQVDASFL